MKIWSKLFLVLATGMMMFSSCLESIEPEGLNDLRGAKADLLRAQTALVEAQAAQANAQAAIAQAEAKIKEAIAAGVRRIEAVTGVGAEELVNGMEETIRTAKAFFNNVPDLAGAIRKMVEENEAYKKQMDEIMKEKTVTLKNNLKGMAEQINGVNVVKIGTSMDPVMLKNAAFMLQKETENFVIAAAFEAAGKPQLLLMYSEDLVKAGHNASADVREAAKLIMGGGGGQPGLATAGGKDVNNLAAALEKLLELATR